MHPLEVQKELDMRVQTIAALAALACFGGFTAAAAAVPRGTGEVYAIASIDILPHMTRRGRDAVQAYVARVRSDRRVLQVWFLEEAATPNHLDVIERFASRGDHDAHIAERYVVDYRNRLHPTLGSPYDEQLFTGFEP